MTLLDISNSLTQYSQPSIVLRLKTKYQVLVTNLPQQI